MWRIRMLKLYHLERLSRESRTTCPPEMTLVYDALTECGERCGRLANSEFLLNLDSQLSYLPEHHCDDVIGLLLFQPVFNYV